MIVAILLGKLYARLNAHIRHAARSMSDLISMAHVRTP